MYEQSAGLSEIDCSYGGGDHKPTHPNVSDEGWQALGDFSDQHTGIYCPKKSALKGAGQLSVQKDISGFCSGRGIAFELFRTQAPVFVVCFFAHQTHAELLGR